MIFPILIVSALAAFATRRSPPPPATALPPPPQAAKAAKARVVAKAAMKTRSRKLATKGAKWLKRNGFGATAKVVARRLK